MKSGNFRTIRTSNSGFGLGLPVSGRGFREMEGKLRGIFGAGAAAQMWRQTDPGADLAWRKILVRDAEISCNL